MVHIDESYVDAQAPNAAAIKNGRSLVLKGKFVGLYKSEDESILFGECAGSGKSNYQCSSDFANPASPTHRCSCPSRQFPCKHCLGLLYAWAQGKTFTVAPVPSDLTEKRDKLVARRKAQKENADKPRKVNKSALKKKIDAQLKGLDLLEQLTHDLLRMGMGNTNAKSAAQINKQALQLGDAYLPGAQSALYRYTNLFMDHDGQLQLATTVRDAVYSEALDQLTRLHSLVKQGRKYLNERLADPELKPDTSSAIAAWLGHAWQLRELKEAGLVENDVSLAQLSFNTYDDSARREFIDTGVWMNLGSGRIVTTNTYRPYKVADRIKGEDSFFQVAGVSELFVYPGDVNPRVRWEEMVPRPLEDKDYQLIREHAHDDISALVKSVKGQLKAPLADKSPVYAVRYQTIAESDDAELIVEDKGGNRLLLSDRNAHGERGTCELLRLLPQSLLAGQVMIARFYHDLNTQLLTARPLALVTDTNIVRMAF
jgi:hypothetical protein